MNIIAFDTETKGFDWFAGETAFIATTADADREYVYDLSVPGQATQFTDQLSGADVIVAHNLSFDVHQVRATLGFDILDLEATLHDTDIAARVLWPESTWGEHGGFGLKNLAKVFLDPNADTEEQAIKDAAKESGIPLKQTGAYYDIWRAYPSPMEAYALKDARYTWDLWALIAAEFEALAATGDRRSEVYYTVEQPIMATLIRAEAHGTPVDQEAVLALSADYHGRRNSLHDSLTAQMGEQALGGEGSQEALVEALLKNGIPLTETTETGQLSTNKFALQRFADAHPLVAEYQEYRGVEKFLSTYIGPLIGVEKVHPSFRQIGAWTGRMSCMRPNMQNIPVRAGSEVRECFIAPEGYKLVVADFDSIEMRILAHYLGHEGAPYRDRINAGEDPHAHMAALLYGGHPDDYAKGTSGEKQRAVAKNSLFAIVYGAGGRRLCDMNNLPTGPPLKDGDWEVRNGFGEVGGPSFAAGKALAKRIKANVPGYMKLMKRVRAKIEAHGYITTLCGRRQAVSPEKSYVGMSALIQGSAADLMKVALAKAEPALADFDSRILLVVHDEIVALAPEREADEALLALTSAMTHSYDLDPPLLTSGTIAQNYGAK